MQAPISLEVPSIKALDNSWEKSREFGFHKKSKVFLRRKELRSQSIFEVKEVCKSEQDLNLMARIHQYDRRVLFLAVGSAQGNTFLEKS